MSQILCIDESGDHSLRVVQTDYPVFVLAGVIVERDYCIGALDDEVRRFKRAYLGRDDVVLHTADIIRQRNGFEALIDPGLRARFYDGLCALIRSLDFRVVACAIHKDNHRRQYGSVAMDPYELCLEVLVERFCYDGGGSVVAEERDTHLNRELMRAWERIQDRGTSFLGGPTVSRKITGFGLRPKSQNISALQLADLVASPIGRHVIGKRPREDWEVVAGKFRRGRNGEHEGYGLVVLPKT